MGAYRCILTHFSQRYPKWPEGVSEAPAGGRGHSVPSSSAGRAAVAFDGMRVPLTLLPVLPALMPAVQAALEDLGADAAEGAAEEAGKAEEAAAVEGR